MNKVRLLLVSRTLLSVVFFLPYIVIFGRSIGLSIATLLLVEAFFALLIVAIDIPTGHFADRIGPRQAVILGGLLQSSAAILLGVFPEAAVFWGVQPLFAAGAALSGGADSALTYGLLSKFRLQNEFERYEGTLYRITLIVAAVSLLSSSLMVNVSLQLPFIATGVVQLMGTVLLLGIPNIRTQKKIHTSRGLKRQFGSLIHELASHSGLRRDLITMISTGTAFSVLLYLLPIYYQNAGATLISIGAISSLVMTLAAFASRLSGTRIGIRVTLVTSAFSSVILGVPNLPLVIIGAVVLQTCQVRLVSRYKSRMATGFDTVGESTSLSLVTSATSIGFAIIAPGLGLVASSFGTNLLLVVCSILFVVAALSSSLALRDQTVSTQTVG